MPKNRSKAKSVQPGPQPAKSPFTGLSPDTEREEMRGNKTPINESKLSFRQQSTLPTIAASPSIAEAARLSGVGESTIHRWMEDEDFREELTNLRQESAELARQEIQGLMLTGLSIMAEAMQSPDESTRIRTARYVLSFGVQIGEAEKLRREVRKLEDAFALLSARKPVH